MRNSLIPSRELHPLDSNTSFIEADEIKLASAGTAATLRLLWNERRFIAKVAIISLIISVLVAFLIPKRYESTTLLMPPDQSSESGAAVMAAVLGKSDGGLAGLGANLLGIKTSGDLFMGVLRSRTIEDAIITKFDLRKVYRDKRWEQARTDLAEHTNIFNDRKNAIITIAVTDRNPQRAANIAAEYVAQLNVVMTQLNTSSAHRERVFLEERLAQVQKDLESSEKDFSEFASKNTALDMQSQGKAMIEAAATLGGNLIASETELQGLKQIYSENNVRVRAMQARVDELRSQELKLTGKDSDTADSNGKTSDSPFPSLRSLPLLGVTYADLARRMKVQQVVFETLTQQYELAKVQEAKELPSVKVLDAANIPETKSYPPRTQIAFLGTCGGAVLAMVWVFGLRRWNSIDPQEPGKALAQEVFGTLRAHLPISTADSQIGDVAQPADDHSEATEDQKGE